MCSLRIVGLLEARRIIGDELEHEAIELGFGEVVRPFGLDRILGGKDEERLVDRVRDAVDGDTGIPA